MNNKGFTLIELLVVVLIIGILAAIALPQYMKAVEKSRASEAITLLGNLANAEKIYQMATDSFTTDLSLLDITMPGVSSATVSAFSTNNFDFTVISADGSTFLVSAQRHGKTSNTDAYMINMAIRDTGEVVRWCLPGTTRPNAIPTANGASITDISGSNANVALCKSISNGNAKGIIK